MKADEVNNSEDLESDDEEECDDPERSIEETENRQREKRMKEEAENELIGDVSRDRDEYLDIPLDEELCIVNEFLPLLSQNI